jgi:hypothetical protein
VNNFSRSIKNQISLLNEIRNFYEINEFHNLFHDNQDDTYNAYIVLNNNIIAISDYNNAVPLLNYDIEPVKVWFLNAITYYENLEQNQRAAAALIRLNAAKARAAAAIADQEAADQEAADLLAAGNLSPLHNSLRKSFVSTIVKMTLIYCNIFTKVVIADGSIELIPNMNPIYDNLDKSLASSKDLNKQIRFLVAKTDLSFPNYPVYWQAEPAAIDEGLYDHFNANVVGTGCPLITLHGTQPKYIIDNAAQVTEIGPASAHITNSTNINNAIFCPLSSKIDGQTTSPTCSLEVGNMDFKIANLADPTDVEFVADDLVYYNGQAVLNAAATYTYTINIKFPSLPLFTLTKEMQFLRSKKDLEAAVAMASTLDLLFKMIDAHPPGSPAAAAAAALPFGMPVVPVRVPGVKLFDHYFKYCHSNGTFITNMYNIAFKGSGDLFQEINAACKYGGYSNIPIYNESDRVTLNTTIVPWLVVGGGDTRRMFIANDQPSACRFIKLIRDGRPAEINQKAYGGYVGLYKQMIYMRHPNGHYRGGNHVKTRISRRKPRHLNKRKTRKSRINVRRNSKRKSRRNARRKTRK